VKLFRRWADSYTNPKLLTPFQRSVRVGLALVAILLIGAVHLVAGIELEFHAFFFLPVIAATWYGSATTGSAAALLSAACGLTADWRLTGGSSPGVTLFNEIVRLSAFLIVAHLVARWKAALERESALAHTDSLTGLANRRAFFDLGAVELARAHRYDHPVTLLFFDLDAFKTVNDTLGHEAGDALLRTVADVLRAHTRATDICGRLGGDEFALLLPETGPEAAQTFATTLRQRLLEAMRLRGWPATFSIGVAAWKTPPEDVGHLVSRADALMYEVKQSGKDSIRAAAF